MRIFIAALLLLPAAALAGSGLDGTWKTNLDSMKVTGKPDVWVFADGMWTCSSCVPEVKVKADGADQKVTGHAYYDTVVVKMLSPTSAEVTTKKAGKVMFTSASTVSADGSKCTGKFTDYSGAKPATGAFSYVRVAAGPAGSQACSGSWQQEALSSGNDALTIVSYEMTSDHFSMRANGQSYDAKFDGKEYPIKGDPGHTLVTLKRIDENTVEETDHRQGKVVDEIRLAAAKDGKTISVTDKDVVHDQTTTYTLEKQQ